MRHHRGTRWITCLTSYRGWRWPLARPGRWTPVFFLDDAVALAAGHRPCGLCRRDAYESYRSAVGEAVGARLGAGDLDRRLAAERLRRGRGQQRAPDRILRWGPVADLPTGTVVVADGRPCLLADGRLRAFTFDGWGPPVDAPAQFEVQVQVLTPPTSVAALAGGFSPVLAAQPPAAARQSA